MVIERGEIWWADLPEPKASSPGFARPVLIIQSDDFNRSRIQTVLVVAITSNLILAEAPGNVPVSKRESGLPKKSVVNVSQVLTLDKSFLRDRCGKLKRATLHSVEEGLKLVLAL